MEEGKQKALTPASASLTALTAMGWDRDQIDLIKRTVAKGATDDELRLFLYQSKKMGLDPLSGQIYCIRRWDSSQDRYVMAIQTGIDGFRLNAGRTGQYRADEEPPRFTYDKNGGLLSAKVAVFRYHSQSGNWHKVEAEAFYSEYCEKKKDGTPKAMWLKMPRNQLAKCCEALALRKAFPKELGDLYIHEEMPAVEDRPPVSMPTETVAVTDSPEPAPDSPPQVTILQVTKKTDIAKTGKKKGQEYTKYGIKDSEGNWHNTFDKSLAETAKEAMELGQLVILTYNTGDYGRELIEIVAVMQPKPALDQAPENMFAPEAKPE